jgi:hypothetical protein
MELWEGIRRYLYRAYPDVEEVIMVTEGKNGMLYIDCGCPAEKHTCSPYLLCHKHGGWDYGAELENAYCYKCLGLESSTTRVDQ